MNTDLDTRARQAAAGLRAAIYVAELRSELPVPVASRRRTRLRPVWVAVALLFGSAVGLALVAEPGREPQPTTTTTAAVSTTTTTTTLLTTTTLSVPARMPPAAEAPPIDTTAPALVVTSPENGASSEEKVIEFSGTTEPGAKVYAGRYEAEVDEMGNWHIVLVLSEGWNTARFTAVDAAGNEATATVKVEYTPPATITTTTTTKPAEDLAPFEAFATFGVSGETPPFDVYYGTGVPGSKVWVQSEYGSGETLVTDGGGWEIKVVFEGLEPGQTIVVKAMDEFGRKKVFEFTFQP